MCQCCKEKVEPKDEVRVIGDWFKGVNTFASIGIIILCGFSMSFFESTNISSFLPIDIISMIISVIILCFIIVVVGWTAAINNTGLGWIVYHCCMGVLIIIEVILSISTANFDGYIKTFGETWDTADDSTKSELQSGLLCCGYLNVSDRPALPCLNKVSVSCLSKFKELFLKIRWVTSTSMFVCFIICLFIDMAAYAMCIHPDIISLEEQQREDEINVDIIDAEENFVAPLAI